MQSENIDYRLMNSVSDLVLCSRCFRAGKVTPVPQLFSRRHTIKNLCSACTEASLPKRGQQSAQRRRLIARYLAR